MGNLFAFDYNGAPFQFLGAPHIGALTLIVLLNLFLLRDKRKDESSRERTRYIIAIVLWIDEIAFHVWNIVHGSWNIQEHLPLHACSILIWIAGYMLIKKDRRIFEFAYFIGIAGAIQALLTPDIGIYGFPHFRFIQTFISHGLLVTSAIYLAVVEGLRPTWNSLKRVVMIVNIYMVIVLGINNLIGSNYLFVSRKPPGPTLLDVLPDWPFYILFMELIGLLMFLLLYLPFFIKDLCNRKTITT